MNGTIRLLYVEDNPSDIDLMREHFRSEALDFEVEVVNTGRACISRLREHTYDVLLLDNHLPDMDAVDVLKAREAQDGSMPVVVITGVGDEDLVVRVLRLGAWDYVAKTGDYIARLPEVLRIAVAQHRGLNDHGHAARRRPRRILYIEQHAPDIDLTLAHFAEHADHLALTIVRSSKEALARLEASPFDLILADFRMPDLNALDLLRELRQRGSRTPVIVVTGRGDELAAIAALKLGAYDYIVKRDDYLTHLPYAIDNAISRSQLWRVNDLLTVELAGREHAEAERARLNEELRQVQKIESLGRLAGGTAHDFNNLLTVIQGHCDLMMLDLHEDDPLRENVEEILAAARRAAGLTRQLLAFSRRQVLHPRVLDLNVSIHESAKMLRRILGEDIQLQTLLDGQLGAIRADPGQLDQVIVNLAINARDAMPEGGTVTVETRNVAIAESDWAGPSPARAGDYILLTFKDDGSGIDPKILPHIFEPFFTTKEHGKGTGLGLAMVHGIVKQSGGWVSVRSEPDQGTTFEVYLPRVEEPVEMPAPPPTIADWTGSETVLVVEDEENVRRLTCHALRRFGYNVLEAANGGEALLVCEAATEPIPLLITDVVMPRMSGPSLASRLRQLHGEMRVLYTSGHTDAASGRQGLPEEVTPVLLEKPFTANDLGQKVREVLDGTIRRDS